MTQYSEKSYKMVPERNKNDVGLEENQGVS